MTAVNDIHKLLEAGADKVAINTGAVNPKLIYDAARIFGSQCIVGEIHAKRSYGNHWEVRTESGRQKHNLDALEWAKRLEELGAGEILLISVDNDGKHGLDMALIKKARKFLSVPITVGGGISCIEDVNIVVKENGLMQFQ